jgi:ABC-type transport system involved in multi-copper enzyme maturation permease subunit
MKYLAILKDSYREAIDTKVFYVMAGLSGVLILLIASISFRPVPAEEALASIVRQSEFQLVYPDRGRGLMPEFVPVHYEVKDVKALTQAATPEAQDYRFTLAVHEMGPGSLVRAVKAWSEPPSKKRGAVMQESKAPVAEKPAPPDKQADKQGPASDQVPETLVAEFLTSQFALVGNLDVTKVERVRADPAGDTSPTYDIWTRGKTGVRGWLHDPGLFFGALPMPFLRATLGVSVYFIEDTLVNGLGAWIAILVGIVITAFFIPNMLRKGTVDLLLVKPIHRATLLVYKYVGGLAFIFLTSGITVGGIWLVLGLRSGIWAIGFLLTVFVLTFFFAILYSVSTLFGVLTRSPIVSILITCFVWFALWLAGTSYTTLAMFRSDPRFGDEIPGWANTTVNTIHNVLPRTKDLDLLTTKLLSHEVLTESEIRRQKVDRLPDVTWSESLSVSGAFIAVMLGLASWRFVTKDY